MAYGLKWGHWGMGMAYSLVNQTHRSQCCIHIIN